MKALITLACGSLIATLALLGCEFSTKLDSKKVEANIASELEKQASIKPKKVVCPESITEKKGETFECEATAEDGTEIKIEVSMEGGGNVRWKTVPRPSSSN